VTSSQWLVERLHVDLCLQSSAVCR